MNKNNIEIIDEELDNMEDNVSENIVVENVIVDDTLKNNTNLIKHLVNEISNLSINEMKEVFKILDKNKIKYTENSNGIYVVLSHVSNDILDDIKKFLIFCQNNKATLDSIDNAQMNEKQNMDKTVKDVVVVSNDTKYITKITHQKDLDKYGLNLDEKEIMQPENQNETIDLTLNKNKIKTTNKSKIIKTQSKSTSTKITKSKAFDES